jgi:hypothetical protein
MGTDGALDILILEEWMKALAPALTRSGSETKLSAASASEMQITSLAMRCEKADPGPCVLVERGVRWVNTLLPLTLVADAMRSALL